MCRRKLLLLRGFVPTGAWPLNHTGGVGTAAIGQPTDLFGGHGPRGRCWTLRGKRTTWRRKGRVSFGLWRIFLLLCAEKHALLLKYKLGLYVNAVAELTWLKAVLIPIEIRYNRRYYFFFSFSFPFYVVQAVQFCYRQKTACRGWRCPRRKTSRFSQRSGTVATSFHRIRLHVRRKCDTYYRGLHNGESRRNGTDSGVA